MYDDNITFVRAGKKQDSLTNLVLGLGLKNESPRSTLEILGNLNHQIYLRNFDFNNLSQDAYLNFTGELTPRFQIYLKDSFAHAYEPRSFQDAFTRTAGHYSSSTNRISVGSSVDWNPQWSLGAGYANQADWFSRTDLAGSYLNSGELKLTYNSVPELSYYLQPQAQVRQFNPGPNILLYGASGGFKRFLTPQTSIDGKVGAQFMRTLKGEQVIKPVLSATFSNELDERTRSELFFKREQFSYPYTQDLLDSWQVGTTLNRQLLERLSGSFSGFYAEGEYLSGQTTDRFWGVSLSSGYDLSRSLKALVSYTYSQTASSIADREYSKNRIFLGLVTEF